MYYKKFTNHVAEYEVQIKIKKIPKTAVKVVNLQWTPVIKKVVCHTTNVEFYTKVV